MLLRKKKVAEMENVAEKYRKYEVERQSTKTKHLKTKKAKKIKIEEGKHLLRALLIKIRDSIQYLDRRVKITKLVTSWVQDNFRILFFKLWDGTGTCLLNIPLYTIEWTIEFFVTLFVTVKKLPKWLETVFFGNSLHDAAMKGDLKICHELVSKGVSIDALDRWERTALYYAVISHGLDVTQYLLMKGANPNAKPRYLSETMLQAAAMDGCLDICRLLVAKGATINATALYYAVSFNKVDVTRYLLENGANLNAKHLVYSDIPFNRETVLHTAVRVATLEICQLLVAKGATVDALDSGDRTPLYYAITLEKLDVTRYLLENGANLNAKHLVYTDIPFNRETVLHTAVRVATLEICQPPSCQGCHRRCLRFGG